MPKRITDSEVVLHQRLARDIYMMTVAADFAANDAVPGNFVMVRVGEGDAQVLRRPFGVAEADLGKGTISFIYKVVGEGTSRLTRLKRGESVNILGPLGNGFSLDFARPLLVGGGLGLAPLLYYAACKEGADAVMGGRTAAEMFWTTLFKPFVKNTFVATDDGTMGEKGFAVDLLPPLLETGNYDGILAVGPLPLMEKTAKLAEKFGVPCQVSLENRMGCGLGACLSCAVKLADGRQKKVCADGPVFWGKEVWA